MSRTRRQLKDHLKCVPTRRRTLAATLCCLILFSTLSFAQQSDATASTSHPTPAARDYPKEIRGYKVELAKVELKKQSGKDEAPDTDSLIRLGDPRVVGLSPLGVTLEVPITVAAVRQGGRVDFLTFEEMVVNGTPVTVNEYQHPFDLPNDRALTLPDPVTIYISTPRAVLGVLGEWNKPAETWPVKGRVYVFGQFKKFLFKFKRVVPLELELSFKNPLRSK